MGGGGEGGEGGKIGPNPHTKSGLPPPKLYDSLRQHRFGKRDTMSLEMHLKDVRQRTRGMLPEEREWRKKWVLDQKLHPDEPIRVEGVHRQLNPFRRFYRYPWDRIFEVFLEPKLGVRHAHMIRAMLPKMMMAPLVIFGIWYHLKYEKVDFQRSKGWAAWSADKVVLNPEQVEKEWPGSSDLGMPVPQTKTDWTDFALAPSTIKIAQLNLGQTKRPW